MIAGPPDVGDRGTFERSEFPTLLRSIRSAGYRIVGPTVRDGAIVYGEIREESDLPIGWTDRQEAGRYRLERRSDSALFGYNVGPHSWKKYLFPSRERLWSAARDGPSFTLASEPVEGPPLAFLGVRACEVAAIAIQDRVFERAGDPGYAARRARSLRIAVQCGQAGSTCFCASMGTGPAVRSGYDLALTEILTPERHAFAVDVGSGAGAAVLAPVPVAPVTSAEVAAVEGIVVHTAASMGRRLDLDGIRDLLVDHPEHPRWADVARRCLACTNCTMACPTCFCSTSEEVPDLSGDRVERWRRWDSCFNSAFSELHGSPVRKSTQSRYRQWMTHKLATWYDQFDSSGCVGCGRCITWCPVGIDLTEEVAAIRANPGAGPGPPGVQ
ncbi:MAG TPA: 4Fe-4S dicluster domain-containing protein [Thermoplasmata archaeon]|nr:4Fe-4S dicluster domain-containing protein [Thermoplasmata archaeon]